MAESIAPRTNLRVGAMVRGKYRIDSFIASGSMSNVYAATHRNGSRVALKILHKDLARDTSLAERFRREGYFGNAVVHPGIVKAIDDDMTDDGCAFLVFDLLEGQTLEQKRERAGGKLPLVDVLNIGDAVLDILQAAHDHQVLHRDLKPDNVYVTRKGDIKLFDFGSARFNDGKSTSEMTATGVVLGTPAFMPPEQATGKRGEVDARSDLWGVGAMLFACLTGQGVHVGGDLKTKSIAVARSKARSLRDVAPEIPRVVAAVVDRSLSFDKAERYADAKSMREALGWARRSLTGEEVESPAMSEDPATRRHRSGSVTDATPIDRDSEEMPTMAAVRVQSLTNEADDQDREEGEEATEKRSKIGARAVALLSRAPEIKRGAHAPSEGVVTSAPPVTLREKHAPSMPPSEGPTFSLRQDPVFSLRDQKGHDGERDKETLGALEPLKPSSGRPGPGPAPVDAPRTERLPRVGSDPETPKLPPGGSNVGLHADPGALFRAALEKGMQATTSDALAHQPPPSPRVVIEATPLPAPMPRAPVPLIMPGQEQVSPLGATIGLQPGMHSTTPGGFAAPAYNTPNPMAFGATALGGSTAPMPGYPGAPGMPGMTGPPPPLEDPIARAQFRNESVSTRPPPGSDQFSSVRPGPLVSSVTAKPKGGGWRILVPILIGIAAGVGTYVVIMKQKAARAHQAAPAPAPVPTVSALPSALTAPTVLPPPSASVAPSASASVAPPASGSAAPAVSVKKKPKPKPKPPPTDQPAPAAEPKPEPAPSPELL